MYRIKVFSTTGAEVNAQHALLPSSELGRLFLRLCFAADCA